MRFLYIAALSALAFSAQLSHCRPQESTFPSPDVDLLFQEDDSLSVFPQETSVVDILQDASKTLNERIVALGDKINEKVKLLKEATDEHAPNIEASLEKLREKFAKACTELRKRLSQLFRPAQYVSFGDSFEMFMKLYELKEKLNTFLEQVKNVTGDKWEKAKEVIKELRREIHEKIQDFLHGSKRRPATYEGDDNDNKTTVVDTLKDIRKTLKEKFLVLGQKIKEKIDQLKTAVGERSVVLREQLNALKQQLRKIGEALKQKILDLFKPAQYGFWGDTAAYVYEKLLHIRNKLRTFVEELITVTTSKLHKLKTNARELVNEISEKIKDLVYGTNGTAVLYSATHESEDKEAYIIDTLRDIGKTLREKFLVLGQQIREKLEQLKKATGQHLGELREQLRELKIKYTQSRDEFLGKVAELFKPAQYSSFGEDAIVVFQNLFSLRERLQVLVKDAKEISIATWERTKALIKELVGEIKQKIIDLLRGSNSANGLYLATDDSNDHEPYIVGTLKDLAKTLREKFLKLGQQIKEILGQLKNATGQHLDDLRQQLRELKAKYAVSRNELWSKILDLFKPAQYASFGENAIMVYQKLYSLAGRLQAFVKEATEITIAKWEKTKAIIKELEGEIKQKVSELLHGSNNANSLYLATDDSSDHEAYIVDTLKDLAKTLREKFLVLGQQIKVKLGQLKNATGQHVDDLRQQLKELKAKYAVSRDEFMSKVLDLFKPAQYASFGENAIMVYQKLYSLAGRLQAFVKEATEITIAKWEKTKAIIKELEGEIKQKVSELLHGSNNANGLYLATDDSSDHEAYIVDTLKDLAKTLREKFLVLGQQIKVKLGQLKNATGQHVDDLRQQLKELKAKYAVSRNKLWSKILDLFKPAQYASFGENAIMVYQKLYSLVGRLQAFVKEATEITLGKWKKTKVIIKELEEQIKQKIRELLHGAVLPNALYQTSDQEDGKAYIVDTLRDIGKTLKENVLVLAGKIKKAAQQLRQATGKHAADLKNELLHFKHKLNLAREALKEKLFSLFKPAQYGFFGDLSAAIRQKLSDMRDKLKEVLLKLKNFSADEFATLQKAVCQLNENIQKNLRELLLGKTTVMPLGENLPTPVPIFRPQQ